MNKKIVILQHGFDRDVFPLLSLVIGLDKMYPNSHIIWAGEPNFYELVKYNKRIHQFVDITQEFDMKTLEAVFECDICVNVSFTPVAKQFASKVQAVKTFGFDKNGPISRQANFFEGVLTGHIATKKTLLQIYYDLANLRWKGEGYGLSYYPRNKQIEKCGIFAEKSHLNDEEGTKICLPNKVLGQLDLINKFASIVTDDLYVAHASIALRKYCTFISELPYQMEFFGKGKSKYLANDSV